MGGERSEGVSGQGQPLKAAEGALINVRLKVPSNLNPPPPPSLPRVPGQLLFLWGMPTAHSVLGAGTAALGGVTNTRARQVGSLDQKSWVGLSREEKDLPRPQGAPCSGCAQAIAENAAQGTYLLIFSRRGWASSHFCEMYNFKM